MIKLIECPRDAMQGLHELVPTETKIKYINKLLEVGFDTIDFGSFVSPKAIPQMRDTAEVLRGLNLQTTNSKLLAIIANIRGAEDALLHEEIDFLGFPLSISETFQQRNTNKNITDALKTVASINKQAVKKNKKQVVYLSMSFGNPYNEPYSPEIVIDFVKKLDAIGVQIISLADTIGSSEPRIISSLFKQLIPAFPNIEFGAHFHSHPKTAQEKIETALEAGCQRLDGAMGGMGGCPMANDDLTGNIATETILDVLQQNGNIPKSLNWSKMQEASRRKLEIFG